MDLKGQCGFEINENEIADLPIVTIYVNFHFEPNSQDETYINDPSGAIGSGQFIASKIVENFNNSMQNVPQNNFPGPNSVPANPLPNSDGHLRMVLYPSFEEALHFYGPTDNYESIYGDKVLDIRIQDNNICSSFWAEAINPPSTECRIYNMFCNDENPDAPYIKHTVPHEVLHTFDLEHSHSCTQRAFDIDPNFECHPNDPSLGCNSDADQCEGTGGNNLMGDNQDGNAITPGQLELIFDHLLNTDFNNFELGSCEKMDPPHYVQSPTEVIWDTPKFYYSDVIVETGTVLRIQCNVFMAHQAKIRVRRGARLIVEGATITSTCPSKEWGGIVVNGNAAIPHHPDMTNEFLPLNPTDSGVLHLKGATLLNAGTAVSTSRCCVSYAEQKAGRGGLILANTTNFKNCRRGIEFLPFFHEDHPNLSAFTDACTFESDRGSHGVTIWGCEGILFDGCHFRDLGDKDSEGNFSEDVGITLVDAGAIIQNQCTFNNLSIGINGYNSAPGISNKKILVGSETSTALRNEFLNNKKHLQGENLDRLFLGYNDFRKNTLSGFNGGVALNGWNKYEINRNAFEDTNLRIARNGDRVNQITNNAFKNGGSYGSIFVIGDNSETIFDGNCFDNNSYDVYLLQNSDSRLKEFQGSSSNPRFNSFSIGHSPFEDFRVPSSSPEQTYYYHPDAPTDNPSLIPRCGINDVTSTCNNQWNFKTEKSLDVPPTANLLPCASLMVIPDEPECITLECLSDIRDSLNYKKELFDGGDKDVLLTALDLDANASSTYQLFESASPYLTDEVIEALIINEDMSESSKSNLLLKNAPLSESMMTVASSHVTASTYQSLGNAATENSISERRLLEGEIDDLEYEYYLALDERIYQLSESANYSEVIATLQFDNTDDSKRRLFGLYLRMEDFVNAQATLNALPENTVEEQVFKEIQEIHLAFSSSTEEFQLTPVQDSLLCDYAAQNIQFSNYARALLTLLKDEVFLTEWTELDYTTQAAKVPNLPNNLNSTPELIPELEFYPNPTHSEVNIKIPNHDSILGDAEIRIYNYKGIFIQKSNLKEGITEVKMDIRSLPEGIYFIGIWNNGKLGTHNKMLVSR